jgi:glycine/D-amino acid oxidase-like deaminating enzyme
MDETYDLVIIGAGEAGQAAAHLARKLGGTVAIINRELFGGVQGAPPRRGDPSSRRRPTMAARLGLPGLDDPIDRSDDRASWPITQPTIERTSTVGAWISFTGSPHPGPRVCMFRRCSPSLRLRHVRSAAAG